MYRRPLLEDSDLPADYRTTNHDLALPSSELDDFFRNDLSVRRIDEIEQHLWLVGRPLPPRPLNNQIVLDRTIIATNEASLHLVWTSKKIFIKPLPRYLLCTAFQEQYLNLSDPTKFSAPALGLLHSYTTLMPTELDFAIAQSTSLIPADYNWDEWRELTRRIMATYPSERIYSHLPVRYRYGELRLSRLDKIYQYLAGDYWRGYSVLTGRTRYIDFLADNMSKIAAATVYTAVVLSAMQVGLALDGLKDDKAFVRACYGFAVFSIISPLIAIGGVLWMLVLMVILNWAKTKKAHHRRLAQMGVDVHHSRVDTKA